MLTLLGLYLFAIPGSRVLADEGTTPKCGFQITLIEEEVQKIYFPCDYTWYFKTDNDDQIMARSIDVLDVIQDNQDKPKIRLSLVDGRILRAVPLGNFPFESAEIHLGGILADVLNFIPWENVVSLTRLNEKAQPEKYFPYTVTQGDAAKIKFRGWSNYWTAKEMYSFNRKRANTPFAYDHGLGQRLTVDYWEPKLLREFGFHIKQQSFVLKIEAFLVSNILMKEKILVLKNSEHILFDSISIGSNVELLKAYGDAGDAVFSLEDIAELIFLKERYKHTKQAIDKTLGFAINRRDGSVEEAEDLLMVFSISRRAYPKRLLFRAWEDDYYLSKGRVRFKDFVITSENTFPFKIGNILFQFRLNNVDEIHLDNATNVIIRDKDGEKWEGEFLFDSHSFVRWEFTSQLTEKHVELPSFEDITTIRRLKEVSL